MFELRVEIRGHLPAITASPSLASRSTSFTRQVISSLCRVDTTSWNLSGLPSYLSQKMRTGGVRSISRWALCLRCQRLPLAIRPTYLLVTVCQPLSLFATSREVQTFTVVYPVCPFLSRPHLEANRLWLLSTPWLRTLPLPAAHAGVGTLSRIRGLSCLKHFFR